MPTLFSPAESNPISGALNDDDRRALAFDGRLRPGFLHPSPQREHGAPFAEHGRRPRAPLVFPLRLARQGDLVEHRPEAVLYLPQSDPIAGDRSGHHSKSPDDDEIGGRPDQSQREQRRAESCCQEMVPPRIVEV